MRTTITLQPDVAAAVESARRERELGVSEAVNHLIRTGLAAGAREGSRFEQRASGMGARVDVANVAEALELLDGPSAR